MEKLILEKLYWRKAKAPNQIDVVLVVSGKAYEYEFENLTCWKPKYDLSDLHLSYKYEELDSFRAKYGQLEITEFRANYDNRSSFIVLCDNLLLSSEFEANLYKGFEDRPQFLYIDDDFRLYADAHERFWNAEIVDLFINNRLKQDSKIKGIYRRIIAGISKLFV